jgi:N-acetylglutamate synthase
MADLSELVAAANHNCVGSYRKLAIHCADGGVHEFGTTTAFVTGVPIGLFNGCLAMGATPQDADLAIEWMTGHDVPYLVWVDGGAAASELGEVARRRGLHEESWALPGMVLTQPPEPPAPTAGVKIEQMSDASLEAWLAIIANNGMPLEVAERLFPPSFVVDPDVAVFAAYLDDEPVGTSIAIRTGDVSGVYAVTTAPAARRRGVGTAAAWAAVNAGRQWGCDLVTLQATEMGFSSYAKMGFETVIRYTTFASPEQSA